MLPLDSDALPEKDFTEYLDPVTGKAKTEQVVQDVQQRGENILKDADGNEVELVVLSPEEASQVMQGGGVDQDSARTLREDAKTPMYKVWQQYDQVYILSEDLYNEKPFFVDQIEKLREIQDSNPEHKTQFGVRFFAQDSKEFLDDITDGALKNKMTDDPYLLWRLGEEIENHTYVGERQGYPRSYILENLNKTLDEIDFSADGQKLLRVHLSMGLNTLNEDLLDSIVQKAREKNVRIEFVDFDISLERKYNSETGMVSKQIHNDMRIFSLEDLVDFFEKHKNDPAYQGLKLQNDIDYSDPDKLRYYQDAKFRLDDEELNELSDPIPVLIDKGKPYEIPSAH